MIICVAALVVFSFLIVHILPSVYAQQKKKVLKSCAELANESEDERRFPLLASVIFFIPALIFYLSSDVLSLLFCFVLAIAAYTDICKRWVPDLIIYTLLFLSVFSLHQKDVPLSLLSVTFYLMPVVLLSLYGYVMKKEVWIASGDFYIFPSIGLMLVPGYAAGVMLTTLVIMLVLMRWIKTIPLVTVAYFTFTGFNLCLLSGFL